MLIYKTKLTNKQLVTISNVISVLECIRRHHELEENTFSIYWTRVQTKPLLSTAYEKQDKK